MADAPASDASAAAAESEEVAVTVAPGSMLMRTKSSEKHDWHDVTDKNGCGKSIADHSCPGYNRKTCSKSAHKAFLKKGKRSIGMARAEKVTVNEEERMRLNGETKEMMDHVKRRWKDVCYDTSVDSEWITDNSLKCRDIYVLVISFIWFPLKIIPMVLPMLFLAILATLPAFIFARRLPAGTDKCERTCGFWVTYVISFIIYFPNLMLLFVCLTLDYVVYYIAGFMFTLCTCRWSKCWASHRALDPYRNGPSLLWYGGPDILACVIGQTQRHGWLGTVRMQSHAVVRVRVVDSFCDRRGT